MDLISIIFLAIGLAMDAFSVSVTLGLTPNINYKRALIIALFFGGFQAFMPVFGWLTGVQLEYLVSTFAPWIAFTLLVVIGIKMIYEALNTDEDVFNDFSFLKLLVLSVATSIDAFAVGVTFAFLNEVILIPIIIIGLITFALSFMGVYIGKNIGHLFENKIEIIGGVILIIIGFKILLENVIL